MRTEFFITQRAFISGAAMFLLLLSINSGSAFAQTSRDTLKLESAAAKAAEAEVAEAEATEAKAKFESAETRVAEAKAILAAAIAAEAKAKFEFAEAAEAEAAEAKAAEAKAKFESAEAKARLESAEAKAKLEFAEAKARLEAAKAKTAEAKDATDRAAKAKARLEVAKAKEAEAKTILQSAEIKEAEAKVRLETAVAKAVEAKAILEAHHRTQQQYFVDAGNFSKLIDGYSANNADLTPSMQLELDALAKTLKLYPAVNVRIEGHACDLGGAVSNRQVGQLRADVAKGFLVRKGIAANRITAVSKGDTEPVAPNTTEENRIKNRRIQVLVVGD